MLAWLRLSANLIRLSSCIPPFLHFFPLCLLSLGFSLIFPCRPHALRRVPLLFRSNRCSRAHNSSYHSNAPSLSPLQPLPAPYFFSPLASCFGSVTLSEPALLGGWIAPAGEAEGSMATDAMHVFDVYGWRKCSLFFFPIFSFSFSPSSSSCLCPSFSSLFHHAGNGPGTPPQTNEWMRRAACFRIVSKHQLARVAQYYCPVAVLSPLPFCWVFFSVSHTFLFHLKGLPG